MENKIDTYIVDSFTDKPFRGNPAGVCLIEDDLNDESMLAIAKELGLSETAFIKKLDTKNKYAIRYFSPKMEIPLCGHATLASSKVLFERDSAITDIHFVNIQNIDLLIGREGKLIKMEFPVYGTESAEVPKPLLDALGLKKVKNIEFNRETNILLLEIDSCKALTELKPDFEALYRSHKSINGVLVTSLSNKDNFDFESRYFWPWSGTNEDPVTGGTHTFLAKYWSERLGKKKMNSFQCSDRTGFMEVELINDNKVVIKSTAQIILEGSLKL
ncbi:PhzF family phenazine biosynthesis protein [Seonamhaeicola sp. ML3]|uniref:PhzF family phenazine biosynthesis protein n=1 Tax=Seonamhaeicola sp. ML3 TaxID=2937786 RepID=UPI00200D7CD4|nr:PhzF family phenazine biosynthesis protein [Seonamhaeicola sp. ML3]